MGCASVCPFNQRYLRQTAVPQQPVLFFSGVPRVASGPVDPNSCGRNGEQHLKNVRLRCRISIFKKGITTGVLITFAQPGISHPCYLSRDRKNGRPWWLRLLHWWCWGIQRVQHGGWTDSCRRVRKNYSNENQLRYMKNRLTKHNSLNSANRYICMKEHPCKVRFNFDFSSAACLIRKL